MSTAETQPLPATRLNLGYDKNLMLFTRSREPGARREASPASSAIDPGPVTLKTFTNGEVYCRYGESIRGADVFIVQPTCAQPRHRACRRTTRSWSS